MPEVFVRSEVLSLNSYQVAEYGHAYTCPEDHFWPNGMQAFGSRTLCATPEGWTCPWALCEYRQNWAHDAHKDWSWLDMKQPWNKEVQKEE